MAPKVILVVVVPKDIRDVKVPKVLAFQALRATMVLKETLDFLAVQGYLADLVHQVRN